MSGAVAIDLSLGPAGLGVLAFRGPDAARFLQGQLSAETEKLAPGSSTLAGFHNPQGRVIALLAVARPAADEFFALLPRELAAPVAQRLGRFVLRSKVRISDESAERRILGVTGDATSAAAAVFAWGTRHVLLAGLDDMAGAGDPAARAAWDHEDLAAGLPQVYAATSESFVAQMLNLDLLGAITFDKGCYTGQEVIARAHYRGRVKRRMQRWENRSGTALEPGQAARSSDGRALVVVRAATSESGSQQILAVGLFGSSAASEPANGEVSPAPEVIGPLPLPYELPA